MKNKQYKRCLRCNRLLKTPIARQRGYGEHCWYLHKQELKRKKFKLFKI